MNLSKVLKVNIPESRSYAKFFLLAGECWILTKDPYVCCLARWSKPANTCILPSLGVDGGLLNMQCTHPSNKLHIRDFYIHYYIANPESGFNLVQEKFIQAIRCQWGCFTR